MDQERWVEEESLRGGVSVPSLPASPARTVAAGPVRKAHPVPATSAGVVIRLIAVVLVPVLPASSIPGAGVAAGPVRKAQPDPVTVAGVRLTATVLVPVRSAPGVVTVAVVCL